jgi:predicted TIM-barrel fold metal-dependent hydrolase
MDLSPIPIVDHHAHALLRRPPAAVRDWLAFFTESREPEMVYGHVPHTLFFRYAVKALAGLLGCEPTPEAVLAARDRLGQHAWGDRLIRDANIATMLIDYGFRGEENYTHEELRERLPCRIEPILRLETLAQELILKNDTFSQVLDAFVAEIEGARAAGYVALKSIIAYRTGLAVREWPGEEVESAFVPVKEQARRGGRVWLASPPLNDTLLLYALAIAERQQMPVQVHTGFGDSDVDLRQANPLHFRPLLQSSRYAHVPWVILHMGYPYVRESAYLAGIYANVYVDLSLAVPFALSEASILLAQLLGLAPTSKLLYASDGFSVPELFWLGAKVGRAALARALDPQWADGGEAHFAEQGPPSTALRLRSGCSSGQAPLGLTASEAHAVAEQILFRNAQAVYGV